MRRRFIPSPSATEPEPTVEVRDRAEPTDPAAIDAPPEQAPAPTPNPQPTAAAPPRAHVLRRRGV